jgi:hypothetical protein
MGGKEVTKTMKRIGFKFPNLHKETAMSKSLIAAALAAIFILSGSNAYAQDFSGLAGKVLKASVAKEFLKHIAANCNRVRDGVGICSTQAQADKATRDRAKADDNCDFGYPKELDAAANDMCKGVINSTPKRYIAEVQAPAPTGPSPVVTAPKPAKARILNIWKCLKAKHKTNKMCDPDTGKYVDACTPSPCGEGNVCKSHLEGNVPVAVCYCNGIAKAFGEKCADKCAPPPPPPLCPECRPSPPCPTCPTFKAVLVCWWWVWLLILIALIGASFAGYVFGKRR